MRYQQRKVPSNNKHTYQICALILLPDCKVTIFVANSTPTVARVVSLKALSGFVNAARRLDFPTPESPQRIILKR